MNTVYKVLAGVGTLIALYLVVSNASNTAKVIETIASNSIAGVQVLQGKNPSVKK